MDKPVEVADGVYAYPQNDGSWWVNTTGFVVGRRDVVAIDSCSTRRRTERFRAAITEVSDLPVRRLVNTHHHGDHTYGNGVFSEAVVIGHDSCRSEVLAAGHQLHLLWPQTDFGDIRITAPTVTYNDRLTVHVSDVEVRLIHPGGVAHTPGDTVVHLPGQGVVFTGDLIFQGGTPFIPMGSLSGSLRALDVLRSLDATTVVPGHGPITDPSAYDATERYLRYVAELAQQGHAKGLTPLETAREADLGVFAELRESERLVANLHRAYAELDGQPEGSPLDPVAVFGDMAEMNGGVPVACHA